jgi:hypothetical protein
MWEYINYLAYIGILGYLCFIAIIIGIDVDYRHRRYLNLDIEPDTFNILGICTLILGIIIISKGITLNSHQFEFISLGIAIFAIGIALFAWGISTESYLISLKSDGKVKEIGNSTFLGIVSSFEDRRLHFQIDSEMLHINLWKALVDLRQAESMIEYSDIDSKHFDTLGKRYVQLLIQVNKTRIKDMLLCEDIQHILHMHLLIKSFRINSKIKRKATLRLKQLLGLEERITNADIRRMIGNIKEDNRWLPFRNKREEIIY